MTTGTDIHDGRDPRLGAAGGLPMWAYVAGLLAILIALGASGALVWQHFSGHALPGCRVGSSGGGSALTSEQPVSACASLEAHPMGSLGGMLVWLQARSRGERLDKVTPGQAAWPVSSIGATYFASALIAWIVIGIRHRRVGSIVHWVARLGALVSMLYLVVIVVSDKVCLYCITSHLANLALVGFLEVGMFMSSRGSGVAAKDRGWGAVAAALAVFVSGTGVLGAMEASRREESARLARADAEAAARAIQDKVAADKAAAAATAAAQPKAETPPWGAGGFVGRWVYGPREAAVRVVIMTSYECPHCREIEDELFRLQEKYKDRMSLSQIHFPLCTDCNTHAGTMMHPNSCWAARAAEAGAIIAGSKAALAGGDQAVAANDAFWKMHKWLFSRGGKFTQDQLKAALPELGFADTEQFMQVMTGKATENLVRGDTDTAIAVGIQETPMIFINGVEFRGWQQRGAITTIIESTIAANPPVMGPQNDKPALAKSKFIEDWRQERIVNFGPEPAGRSIGPADAKVVITMWADFTEPNTKKAYDAIKPWTEKQSVRLVWRHFPGTKACNPALPKDFFPNGCIAAQAAEAAGVVGGPEAFWKMGEWLFVNREGVTPNRVQIAANMLELDETKFKAAQAAAAQTVTREAQFGQTLGIDRIPKIFVNGKWVRQWISDDQKDLILKRIVDDAESAK